MSIETDSEQWPQSQGAGIVVSGSRPAFRVANSDDTSEK